MSNHAQLTERTGAADYFCDPHSTWQPGSNENTSGLPPVFAEWGKPVGVHARTVGCYCTELEHTSEEVALVPVTGSGSQ